MSKTLTDNEVASLEKVAQLRGECGRLRKAIRRAESLMASHLIAGDGGYMWDHEHIPLFAIRALLEDALAVPFSEEQG